MSLSSRDPHPGTGPPVADLHQTLLDVANDWLRDPTRPRDVLREMLKDRLPEATLASQRRMHETTNAPTNAPYFFENEPRSGDWIWLPFGANTILAAPSHLNAVSCDFHWWLLGAMLQGLPGQSDHRPRYHVSRACTFSRHASDAPFQLVVRGVVSVLCVGPPSTDPPPPNTTPGSVPKPMLVRSTDTHKPDVRVHELGSRRLILEQEVIQLRSALAKATNQIASLQLQLNASPTHVPPAIPGPALPGSTEAVLMPELSRETPGEECDASKRPVADAATIPARASSTPEELRRLFGIIDQVLGDGFQQTARATLITRTPPPPSATSKQSAPTGALDPVAADYLQSLRLLRLSIRMGLDQCAPSNTVQFAHVDLLSDVAYLHRVSSPTKDTEWRPFCEICAESIPVDDLASVWATIRFAAIPWILALPAPFTLLPCHWSRRWSALIDPTCRQESILSRLLSSAVLVSREATVGTGALRVVRRFSAAGARRVHRV